MRIAIMQPYFFPYIGYFHLISAADTFVFFDDVNFIKRGWINRNHILANNTVYRFTLPLNKPSQNKAINEVYLNIDHKWRDNFLRTIEQAYKKAPYFTSVFPLIETIVVDNSKSQKISSVAIESIKSTLSYLNIRKVLKVSSEIDYNRENPGEEKIISICKTLGATHYINAIDGQDLYSKDKFSDCGLELSFVKTDAELKYQQFDYSEFTANLSIIDVLMFNSKESVIQMLTQYRLL
uniref:WbqC family protein n=1 Tax=Roseihalotalea indica TaxID=2867963 RepID=A0AA49JE97_9BACT|nr:WbqC family protein [Tunicatimonas sp. TK19036]